MEKLGIADRSEPRVTLKGHKQKCITNPTVRLIWPCISDIGKVSKSILYKFILNLKIIVELNLWSTIWQALEWSKFLNVRANLQFIQVDTVEYCSSINEIFFNNALIFAKNKWMYRSEIENIKLTRISSLRFKNIFG